MAVHNKKEIQKAMDEINACNENLRDLNIFEALGVSSEVRVLKPNKTSFASLLFFSEESDEYIALSL